MLQWSEKELQTMDKSHSRPKMCLHNQFTEKTASSWIRAYYHAYAVTRNTELWYRNDFWQVSYQISSWRSLLENKSVVCLKGFNGTIKHGTKIRVLVSNGHQDSISAVRLNENNFEKPFKRRLDCFKSHCIVETSRVDAGFLDNHVYEHWKMSRLHIPSRKWS